MPNLNLLEGKPFQREVDLSVEEAPAVETEPVPQGPEPVRVEEPSAAGEKETASAEEKRPLYYRERRSSFPYIMAAVGIFVIVLVLIFAYRGKKEGPEELLSAGEDTTQVAEQEATAPEAEKPAEAQPAQPLAGRQETPAEEPVREMRTPAPAAVAVPGLQEGRAKATVAASLLDDVLGAIPSQARLQFFSFSGSTYMLELAGLTEDVFQQFVNRLSGINPALVPKMLFETERMWGDRPVVIRQYRGKIPRGQGVPAAETRLASGQIRNSLTALVQQKALEIRQFGLSPAATVSGQTIRTATLKLYGDQARVVDFIQTLLNRYGNVGISKVLVTVMPSSQFADKQVTAVVDVDVYL
jgi:hypothetical protein